MGTARFTRFVGPTLMVVGLGFAGSLGLPPAVQAQPVAAVTSALTVVEDVADGHPDAGIAHAATSVSSQRVAVSLALPAPIAAPSALPVLGSDPEPVLAPAPVPVRAASATRPPQPAPAPASPPPSAKPAPAPPAPAEPAEPAAPADDRPRYEIVGEQAMARVQYIDISGLGWSVVFHQGRDGYLGIADPGRKVVDIWVRDSHDVTDVLGTVAHELGHVLDYEVWTDATRDRWLELREVDLVWWPSCTCDDRGYGAGDIAEALVMLEAGAGEWTGWHGLPTQAQLDWLKTIVN